MCVIENALPENVFGHAQTPEFSRRVLAIVLVTLVVNRSGFVELVRFTVVRRAEFV